MNHHLIFLCICIGMVSGCAAGGSIMAPEPGSEVDYSAVYIIHADADYLYHEEGRAKKANEKVLEEAREVGEQALNGEIFIFHQLPKRKFLGLFPRKNREFLLYRNGEQAGKQTYHPETEKPLIAETTLYQQHSNRKAGSSMILLYFGHEIPSENGQGYHRSRPDIPVNITTFTSGLQGFATDSTPFSLTALSTCNNGSPQMMKSLSGITEFVLASPQNLHLSHLDTRSLFLLEADPDISGDELARAMAENTFQRLINTTQTPVTLSVYNLEKVQQYISEFEAGYMAHIGSSQATSENRDCSLHPFFRETDFSVGVQNWYRPSRFGRNSDKSSHSGWGCLPGN